MGIGIIKKLIFWFVFLTYLHVFLLKFNWESSLDVEFNSAYNEYPHCIPLTDPTTQKTINTWKNVFSGISYFWGSGVHQKYAVWVLVSRRIKFHIQRALPPENWVKTEGDMSKIRTQKVVFFFLPPKSINIILLF